MNFYEFLNHKLILERLVIGLEEPILIKGVGQMMAKVDSGNDGYNVIHGEDCYQEGDVLVFSTYDINGDLRKVSKKIVDTVNIHIGSGNIEERPVVNLNIKFANEEYKEIPFSVANRGKNKMKVLISKNFVKDELNALIDVGAVGISTDGIEYEQISEGQTWDGVKRILATPFKTAGHLLKLEPWKATKSLVGGALGGTKDVLVGSAKNVGNFLVGKEGKKSSSSSKKTSSRRRTSSNDDDYISDRKERKTDNASKNSYDFQNNINNIQLTDESDDSQKALLILQNKLIEKNHQEWANRVSKYGFSLQLLDYEWNSNSIFGTDPSMFTGDESRLEAYKEKNNKIVDDFNVLPKEEKIIRLKFKEKSEKLISALKEILHICKSGEPAELNESVFFKALKQYLYENDESPLLEANDYDDKSHDEAMINGDSENNNESEEEKQFNLVQSLKDALLRCYKNNGGRVENLEEMEKEKNESDISPHLLYSMFLLLEGNIQKKRTRQLHSVAKVLHQLGVAISKNQEVFDKIKEATEVLNDPSNNRKGKSDKELEARVEAINKFFPLFVVFYNEVRNRYEETAKNNENENQKPTEPEKESEATNEEENSNDGVEGGQQEDKPVSSSTTEESPKKWKVIKKTKKSDGRIIYTLRKDNTIKKVAKFPNGKMMNLGTKTINGDVEGKNKKIISAKDAQPSEEEKELTKNTRKLKPTDSTKSNPIKKRIDKEINIDKWYQSFNDLLFKFIFNKSEEEDFDIYLSKTNVDDIITNLKKSSKFVLLGALQKENTRKYRQKLIDDLELVIKTLEQKHSQYIPKNDNKQEIEQNLKNRKSTLFNRKFNFYVCFVPNSENFNLENFLNANPTVKISVSKIGQEMSSAKLDVNGAYESFKKAFKSAQTSYNSGKRQDDQVLISIINLEEKSFNKFKNDISDIGKNLKKKLSNPFKKQQEEEPQMEMPSDNTNFSPNSIKPQPSLKQKTKQAFLNKNKIYNNEK